MDFNQELAGIKKKIDVQIARHFDKAIRETKKRDAFSAELLSYAKKLTLSGGKRLRPALLIWGYAAAGGKDQKKIMQAAVGIEMIHMFLLIHDDIMDKGKMRHGIDSFNLHFQKVAKKIFKHGDPKDFGDSCALIAGDMLYSIGNNLIINSGFDSKNIAEVVERLQKIVLTTAVGQMQDIHMEYANNVSEKSVLQMYNDKTAQYTFEGPLVLGAMLAGKKDLKFMERISSYAIPLGIAFQIQDDVLGIFGVGKKIGKSSTSDIEEGKQTLLVVKAMENGSKIQVKKMEQILGKKNISKSEIKEFQKIMMETGSLDFAKKMIMGNIAKSKKSLERIEMPKNAKEFLFGIADFMEKRQS